MALISLMALTSPYNPPHRFITHYNPTHCFTPNFVVKEPNLNPNPNLVVKDVHDLLAEENKISESSLTDLCNEFDQLLKVNSIRVRLRVRVGTFATSSISF